MTRHKISQEMTDVQLRQWFEHFGPPPLDDTIRFNFQRLMQEIAPRQIRHRRSWGWSVDIAGILIGLIGGGAWLTKRPAPPSPAQNHLVSPLFNPVVNQTLQWLHQHTRLSLSAPTWLPPVSSGASDLSGMAKIYHVAGVSGVNGWQITLYPTNTTYGVNSPKILKSGAHPWLSWLQLQIGPSEIAATTSTPLERLQTLESSNASIGPNGPQITSQTSRAVVLGSGVSGTLYTTVNTVLWHEGAWTFLVLGNNGHQNVQMAKMAVRTLRNVFLPQEPGLAVIAGNRSQAEFTHNIVALDWFQGSNLIKIDGYSLSMDSVFHVAASWAPYTLSH